MQKADGYSILRSSASWRALDEAQEGVGFQPVLPRATAWVTPHEMGVWGFCPESHRLKHEDVRPTDQFAAKGIQMHKEAERQSRMMDNLRPFRMIAFGLVALSAAVLLWRFW